MKVVIGEDEEQPKLYHQFFRLLLGVSAAFIAGKAAEQAYDKLVVNRDAGTEEPSE